jgi:hypothetical protein
MLCCRLIFRLVCWEVVFLGRRRYECHVLSGVSLPCYWLIGGFCGVNGRKCDVKEVVKEVV